MGDVNEILKAAISEGVRDSDLHLSDIPDLDLYIDQILTLVANKNRSASDRYQDNVLTKTMINNYSKEGLLMPVKGKKYTKEHIVQMLLIYSLKSTLSIGEIHRMLEGARGDGVIGEELMACYDRHIENKERVRQLAAESAETIICDGRLEREDSSEFFVALLDLLSYSAYLRNIAIELLEARYPEVEEIKEKEKKDKDKDKKPAEPSDTQTREES